MSTTWVVVDEEEEFSLSLYDTTKPDTRAPGLGKEELEEELEPPLFPLASALLGSARDDEPRPTRPQGL